MRKSSVTHNIQTAKELLRVAKDDNHLDPLIAPIVKLLNDNSIYTTQSCQGGFGHSYDEPTIEFNGDEAEAFRAYALCIEHGYKVDELRWVMKMERSRPSEIGWQITFNFGRMHNGFFQRNPEHCTKSEIPMLRKMLKLVAKRIAELA